MEHYDDNECPITLEPLDSLPYPAFALSSSASSNNTKHYFDGAALATYIISQGTFTNPLTREPLKYEDCVRLDEYLDEYCTGSELYPQHISVREAWSLRESIKVNVAAGGDDAHHRQREEVLRNEASVALRGLFVFGHERRRGPINNNNASNNETAVPQTIPRAAGGFNLNHIQPDSHAWGFGSTCVQDGLRIIDDDELAYEAADDTAWREVQEAFPLLNGDDAPLPTAPCAQIDNTPSQILSIARQTAELTINEERAKKEEEMKQRQRYFLEALERKRQRIEARRKAKKDAENVLISNQKATAVKQSAREEIDRWLSQKWNEWESESDALTLELEAKQKVDATSTAKESKTTCTQKISCSSKEKTSVPSAEEKATKMAAKKKAKRQKAKERSKEKKRIERIELEKKERAIYLQKERENSAIKCSGCGEGILGVGFDKFGKKFCSTKCARASKEATS